MSSTDWKTRAACRGMDRSIFFPGRDGDGGRAAKKVCAVCPVKQDCLDWATNEGLSDGVMGGLVSRALERRRVGMGITVLAPEFRAGLDYR